MSWTTPRTWVAGEVLTAALLNTHLRDNLGAIAPTPVTSLPGSPATGDWALLTDSLTVPTYQWLFRYNGSSSNTDKWEFMGGPPGFAEVTTDESTASGTFVALATAGPVFALPRAGVYDVAVGFSTKATDASNGLMSYDIGGTGAVDGDGATGSEGIPATGNQPVWGSAFRVKRKTGLTAVTLTAKYRAGNGTMNFQNRIMSVTPVRVS